MSGRLMRIAVPVATEMVPKPVTGGSYATLSRARVLCLARTTPDCQSAVLLLLVWQATLHEKMKRGRLAGRLAASLSGNQLADMTARPLRTVRHALQRLTAAKLLVKECVAGRKNTYTLPFLAQETR